MSEQPSLFCANSDVCCRSFDVKCRRKCSSNIIGANTSEDDTNGSSYQPIADYYAGKSVFLTGGTGFLGKVFIEKLLYTCEHLDKIYMLVRDRKGVSINDRMEEIYQNPLFTRLRTERPGFLKKVVPVTGDLTLPNLGIKAEDEKILVDKVSVVIHSAATIRFNEAMPVAMKINFEGTLKVLELCKRINNLQVFVYISTAYTHTHRMTLKEKIYPPPEELRDVYKFIEHHGDDERETIKFIDPRPNTYTFTKALTESYIAENRGDIPTIIIRPSIVTPIKDGPLKGWLDNWFGATRIFHNVGTGWERVSLGTGSCLIDLIPVDYVCNLTIVAAARCNKSKETQVFNCCTSSENPINMSEAYRLMIRGNTINGLNEMPYPSSILTESKVVVKILTIVLQLIPAYIADLFLRIIGRQPKFVEIQTKVIHIREHLEFFTVRSWIMKSAKARELSSTLSGGDKIQFPCDPTHIKWDEYMYDYCLGIHKYLKQRNLKSLN